MDSSTLLPYALTSATAFGAVIERERLLPDLPGWSYVAPVVRACHHLSQGIVNSAYRK
jgi:hypothetical protein